MGERAGPSPSLPTGSPYRGSGQRALPRRGSAPSSPRQREGRTRVEVVVETLLSPVDRSEDLTISWRRQILQSEAESQRIAVRKLLNRLQHPGWYVSRLQTIRCGHTARGSYWHLGGRTPAFSGTAEFPLHGLLKGRLEARPLNLPPSANRTRYR